MSTLTFREVALWGERSGNCACGKKRTRRQKFYQTINPFNRNRAGQMKTPALSIPAAIGISSLVGFPTYQPMKDEPETWKLLTLGLIMPAFALAFGYVVTWWMP